MLICDAILDTLSLDPLSNLQLLARKTAEAVNAPDCHIMSNETILASASGTVPLVNMVKIPITPREWNDGFTNDQRVKTAAYSKSKTFVCLPETPFDTETFQIFTSLIVNNAEAYLTLQSASTDKLTGALNRKYLDTAIDQAFENARATGRRLSVIICDLDFFKHVNDTYGHLVGDEVLRDTSKIIRETIGNKGILGRYGGEEFVILLNGSEKKENGNDFAILLEDVHETEAGEIAENLRQAIHSAKVLGDKRDVTVSLGLATYPTHANTRKTLVEKADKALYIAKKSGRNRFLAWDESMSDAVVTKNLARELITGDTAKDGAKMMTLLNLLYIAALNISLEEKLNLAFEKITDTVGTKSAILFTIKNSEITNEYKLRSIKYSDTIINNVITTKTPVFQVDWDNETPDEAGMADWQSTAAAPCIKNGELVAVLCLTVSVKEKEFTEDECGFIINAANLLAAFV